MWVWSEACMWVQTLVCTCARERSAPGIFICYSLTYFMREDLSLSLELLYSGDPPLSPSPALGFQAFTTMPRFYFNTKDLSLGLHAWTWCTLPTGPSPQSAVQGFCFYVLKSNSAGNVKKKLEREEDGASKAGGTLSRHGAKQGRWQQSELKSIEQMWLPLLCFVLWMLAFLFVLLVWTAN